MQDPGHKPITITFKGEELPLLLSKRAIRRCSTKATPLVGPGSLSFWRSFIPDIDEAKATVTWSDPAFAWNCVVLTWVAVQHLDRDITIDDIDEALDPDQATEHAAKLLALMERDIKPVRPDIELPEPEAESEDEQRANPLTMTSIG